MFQKDEEVRIHKTIDSFGEAGERLGRFLNGTWNKIAKTTVKVITITFGGISSFLHGLEIGISKKA